MRQTCRTDAVGNFLQRLLLQKDSLIGMILIRIDIAVVLGLVLGRSLNTWASGGDHYIPHD